MVTNNKEVILKALKKLVDELPEGFLTDDRKEAIIEVAERTPLIDLKFIVSMMNIAVFAKEKNPIAIQTFHVSVYNLQETGGR